MLAYGAWLAPADAGRLDGAVGPLRERGEAFRMTLATAAGGFVEAEGRTVAGRALLRLQEVSPAQAAARTAAQGAAGLRDARDQLRARRDAGGGGVPPPGPVDVVVRRDGDAALLEEQPVELDVLADFQDGGVFEQGFQGGEGVGVLAVRVVDGAVDREGFVDLVHLLDEDTT